MKEVALPGKAEIDIAVGRSVNRLRLDRGMTVTTLAKGAGLSGSMISRLENGQVSPSLGTLAAIADALSVPVMALLAQTAGKADVYHVKAGKGIQAHRITANHTHQYMLLGKHSGPSGDFEAARVRISRENAGELPRYIHDGYVFLTMTSGKARYICGGSEFELAPGDTLSFDAKLEHGVSEILSREIEFITVFFRRD